MRGSLRKLILRPVGFGLTAIVILACIFALALRTPLVSPPFLESIHRGAVQIDQAGLAPLSRLTARDGTELAYRFYAAAPDGASKTIAILVHGSSANSRAMTAVATALARAGVEAAAVDMRGHGASGSRGDIAFIGQLEQDLDDLVGDLKRSHPDAHFVLIGHSSGGGFALRIASETTGDLFDRFVFLSPFLGYRAPTNRPAEGATLWAQPDLPRIFALLALNGMHIHALDGLPTLAFATGPGAERYLTPRYSFRLMQNFGPPADLATALAQIRRPAVLIAGAQDELFDSARYPEALRGFEDKVALKITPDVDHMGMVHAPAALAAIVATVRRDGT